MALGYEVHLSDSEYAAQFLRRHLHRPRRRRGARRRLGKRSRHSSMESGVSLHFLHDLMNVSIERGEGAEPLEQRECLLAVRRAPAPVWVYGPERNMREEHDRSAVLVP